MSYARKDLSSAKIDTKGTQEPGTRRTHIYPSRQSREIHIGRVMGPYQYRPGGPYPNQRPVRWLKNLPRTHFSQGALYELGSAMSFFQMKTYAEEFQGALEGQPAAPPEEDETVAMVAEDIEDQTRDFIIKRLAQILKGHPLSEFVAHLLQTMGYRTRVTPPGPDRGIDIIAHKDELGFEPPLVKVQVKSGEGSVGEPVVSALSGKVGDGEYGLLVSLGDFTPPAEAFARSKNNLRLINGSELGGIDLATLRAFRSSLQRYSPVEESLRTGSTGGKGEPLGASIS